MRQSLLHSLLEDDEDAAELTFVSSRSTDENASDVAAAIREQIAITADQQQAAANSAQLFALLRDKFERAGVFVILVGDLGSYHSDISPETFRGYAIADRVAPLIVVNDNDAKAAQLFTLVHEAGHLWTGTEGISTATFFGLAHNDVPPIERFCNEVAAELLMPAASISHQWEQLGAAEAPTKIQAIALSWNVSRPAAAYRSFRLGFIHRGTWINLRDQYQAEWQQQREAEKPPRSDQGGPSYYVVRRNRLGNGLLATVRRSVQSGDLTYTEASRILDVRPNNVAPLLEG